MKLSDSDLDDLVPVVVCNPRVSTHDAVRALVHKERFHKFCQVAS
jgi:hypothetical protein